MDIMTFCINPRDYKIFDRRISKPIYYKMEDPFVGQEVSTINFKDNAYKFFTPNSIGILLQISQKNKDAALNIYENHINPKKIKHSLKDIPTEKKTDLLIERSIITADFIELIQISVVFAYSAVESFVNTSIPMGYIYKNPIKSKNIVEKCDKEEIERRVSLTDKLSKILTDIYKTEKITEQAFWSDFKNLERLRVGIVHQKSSQRSDFFERYFKNSVFRIIDSAKLVLEFFYHSLARVNETIPYWPWGLEIEDRIPVRIDNESMKKLGEIE